MPNPLHYHFTKYTLEHI